MEALGIQYERVADMRVEDFGDDDELVRPAAFAKFAAAHAPAAGGAGKREL